ncbi:PREDICTED: uncharacterized protein LOC109591359 [Amphimedon queenslandica]|uniref:Death domain-containing protein n=1 Tax=Amphimedon queenslandica TaxID=400682 RepID=A0A1X7SUR1_AMPQE|nr:PREDICTED: uncharacterized protein LOC109591359 [Amphimedon queenslandica]|eukprot:XP_019862665.1 PREDICTED: uncharacterized protein LOC109591359 [Amphimedon queenslandica]
MPEAPDRVQFDFPNQQSLSAASSLPSATNQQSMSPGDPPAIGSSVSSSIAQSITITDVDLPDNELITGTSSALLSLSHVSNTEAKGLSTTSSATSAAVRSPDHSMSSTSTAISRDNPPSTSSSLPPSSVITVKDLQAIFMKYFSTIAETIKLDSVTFATQLMSASIIDSSVVQKVTFTQGWTPPQQANTVLFAVDTGLKNFKDPVKLFIDFCSVLQDYVHAKEIAIDMMRDANLSFPEAPPLVVHHSTTPTVAIPPPTHTPSAHGTAMAGASTSTSTGIVAEAPSCDFSQYHDVNRYGQPTMIELLNWIVAKNPSIWNEVGSQLGISDGNLNAIQRNISFGANPKLLFKGVLSLWETSRSRPYTWGTILNALASPIVEQVGLAQDVARKLDSK